MARNIARLEQWARHNAGNISLRGQEKVSAAVQAFSKCYARYGDSSDRQTDEATFAVRITVTKPDPNIDDPTGETQVAAEGFYIFADRIQVGVTDVAGMAFVYLPIGTYTITVIGLPGHASEAETLTVDGVNPASVSIPTGDGKEISAYSYAVVDELEGDLLPAPFSGLHIGFISEAEGNTVALNGEASVIFTDNASGEVLILQDVSTVDGKLVVPVTAELTAFITNAKSTITIEVDVSDTSGWPHADIITFTYASAPIDDPGAWNIGNKPIEVEVYYPARKVTKHVICQAEKRCNLSALPKGRVEVKVIKQGVALPAGIFELHNTFPLKRIIELSSAVKEKGGPEALQLNNPLSDSKPL